MKYRLTFGIIRREATQRVVVAKLTRLSHKIVIQLPLVAEGCTICSSRSGLPVRELLDKPSCFWFVTIRTCAIIASSYIWILYK